MRRTTTLLLALTLAAMALPAAAQRRPACPRIPSVSSDPLNRGYKAGDVVPAELLDPPFAWAECPPAVVPVGAMRTAQPRVVFLSVTVDEAGAVADARPRGAIDPEGYYEAAVAALRNWRTGPPRWRGLKVKASIAVDVSFARAESPATEQPAAGTAPSTPAAVPATAPTTAPASVQSAPPAEQPATSVPSTVPPVTRAPESTPQPVAAAQPSRTAPATETPRATPLATQQPAPMAAPAQMQPAPPVTTPPVARIEARVEPAVRMETPERSEARTQPPVTQPSQARTGAEPFVVEYYYKVKWGYADEFWHLFNRNHWPLLQRQMQMGRILEVRAAKPRYHATEDGRWDYRVTIIFRSAAEANAPFDTEALERQLFPDFEAYRREERHRFELLLAHWDVPITPADLEP